MVLIKKYDFGVTSEMMKDLLRGWDIERKREGNYWKGEIS